MIYLRSISFIVFFCCTTSLVHAQVNITFGLAAHYPFNGNANDISGNNHNPTFNNATLTTDRFGNPNNAYSFNGINNYIQIPSSPGLNFGNQISLVVWVKPTGFYYGTCHGNSVILKGDDGNFAGRYAIRFDDGQFLNSNNCSVPIPDTLHENYWGAGAYVNGGYTPYVTKNEWVSVIYTYDGTTAKLFINCQEVISNNVSGLTFSNSYDLLFGKTHNTSFPYWFNGAMDDIRIYNRALNQDEVEFLGGCNTNEVIINTYTPVIAFDPCKNNLTVEDASTFNPGDTVLLIQMKGADIDSSNTAAFGNITDYNNAGNYEFNYVRSKTGNVIELKNIVTRQYDIPIGKVQLIRVPYYQNKTFETTVSCLPWDGNKGGVLAFLVEDTITLNANLDVKEKGFRGGNDPYSNPSSYLCYENNFFYPPNQDLASGKGEGITTISSAKSFGKGALANGGGGGNSHNSGGGGGSNGVSGGFGGYNFEGAPCTNTPFDNRGIGGNPLTYNNTNNRIFLGGGGGAGHTNNPEAFEAKGGNGGGIIIIKASKLLSNGNRILANGAEGLACGSTGSRCHEGMGGGGAGGTILMDIASYLDNITIETRGGKGGDMTASGFLKVGPGGGGGGGIIWFSNPSVPANVSTGLNGGASGTATSYSNNPFGATAGANGNNILNLQLPVDIILFKPSIDSVGIKDSLLTCNNIDFDGQAYINRGSIVSWQWDFGDGSTATTQNTSHSYIAAGVYTVKLVITDINGCKDSITKVVQPSFLTIDAGPSDTICTPSSTILLAASSGPAQYAWTPAAYVNNPSLLNPVATPPSTTTFYISATNAAGCTQIDSVRIEVRSSSAFTISPPVETCMNQPVQLSASGGDFYSWTPAGSLNDPSIANPIASPGSSTPYTVSITDTLCGNSSSLSTLVNVLPLPNVRAAKSNDIDCFHTQTILSGSGALQYLWSPSSTLINPSTSTPVAKPTVTTQYYVAGIDSKGCINTDSITVMVSNDKNGAYLMPTAFTPNNDGLNDCYGVKYWGEIKELEFSIYNRWGERVFFTRNPSACWDGTINGVRQNPAVFVFMIKAKTTCQDYIFRKGTFALIR